MVFETLDLVSDLSDTMIALDKRRLLRCLYRLSTAQDASVAEAHLIDAQPRTLSLTHGVTNLHYNSQIFIGAEHSSGFVQYEVCYSVYLWRHSVTGAIKTEL